MKMLALLPALLAAGCIGLERKHTDTGSPLDDTSSNTLDWGDLLVEPNSVDFGQVEIGDSATATVVLSYEGEGDIIVSEASVADGGSTMVIQNITGLPTALSLDDEVIVDLLFSPASEQAYSGTLDFVTDHASAGTFSVPLEGTGYRDTSDTETGADIAVSPSSIDFGLIDTGTSETRTLTVSNIGTETFFLTDIETTHPAIEWDFEEYMPLEFDPGESEEVTVTWTPSAIGTLEATLDFLSDCEGEELISVPLTGESDDICDVCAPMISVDTGGEAYAMEFFGFSALGALGVDTQTVYVTNSGDQTLTISDVYVTDDWLAPEGTFSTNWNSSQTLEPWQSYQVDVSYTATGLAFDLPYESLDQNILHIISDASNDSDYAILLTGTGI